MKKPESWRTTAQSIGQLLLTLIFILIAIRMLLGLAVLALTVTGAAVNWLQDGAPLDWLTFRPRDFIITGGLLIIAWLLNKVQENKTTEEEASEKPPQTS